MDKSTREFTWHNLFEAGIFLKGINGIWEIILGSIILLVQKSKLLALYAYIFRNELIEDPKDKILNFFAPALFHLSSTNKVLAGLYILTHGALNIFLAVQLYRKKVSVYIYAIWIYIALGLFQCYRLINHFSLTLFVITVFDAVFIILAWHEYKYRLSKAIERID